MMNFKTKKTQEISGELLHQEIADVKIDELKEAEDFHQVKDLEQFT